VALDGDRGDLEGVEYLLDERKLLPELVRRLRPALYSAYWARRTVGGPLSNATAIRSGFSSVSSLISIEVKP
jgi:hypothetical protein